MGDLLFFVRRNIRATDMDFLGAALWVGRRWYKFLERVAPEDFYQTAALAAAEVAAQPPERTERARFRWPHRRFRELARSLGFRKVGGRWNRLTQLEGELVDPNRGIPGRSVRPVRKDKDAGREDKGWGGKRGGAAAGTRLKPQRPCGVCGERSFYNDERFGRLCRRCQSVVSTRRRRGWENPYKDLHLARRAATREKPPCGVPGCGEPADYRDERFGRLCTRHGVQRDHRRKRGWRDPYKGWLRDQETIREFEQFPVPDSLNRAFWKKVRGGVTDAEWAAMWLWAHEEAPTVGEEILAKARAAAGT